MVDDGHQHATSAPNGHNTNQQSNLTLLNPQPPSAATNSSGGATPFGPPSPSLPTGRHQNQTRGGQPAATRGSSFAGMFPATKQTIMKPPLISQEKFHWDQTEQGHILGAFFYGYILFQIPGARMAELVGARWILMVSTAGSALISLIFPLSTQLDSIHLLMVLRFAMGLCQSAFFPAAYVFFCRWLPEAERSVLLPIMFIGSNMGSISTYIMSSYLISSSYGWPSVFYVSGLVCLMVTVLWCIFGSNGPQDNWLITKEECDYIMDNVNGSLNGTPNRDGQHGLPAGRDNLKRLLESGVGGGSKPLVQARFVNNGALLNSCHTQTKPTTINKSKSANDLNPNQPGCLARYHPDVITLETGAKMKPLNSVGPAAASTGNRNQLVRFQPIDETNLTTPAPNGQEGGRQLSWCKLLSSVPVWTLIFSMYGNEWSQVVLTYELPTYLNKALDIPIEQNGVINSFFQLSYTVASPILSSLGAYMLDKHLFRMRKIHVRKLFQSLATFGQLACFASVPICGPNRGLIIMFMFSAIVFKACANAGDIMVAGDLSPEFAGTIFALANSVGNTAGFFVPILAGVIVEEQYKREHWTPFWLTTASIMGCSGLIFLIFGETRRQNYSADDDEDGGEHDKSEGANKTPTNCIDHQRVTARG